MNTRKNVRANLDVRVLLEGADHHGAPFRILGQTVDFSRRGLGITIQQDIVAPGSVVKVSSSHKFHSDATVQWVSHDSASGRTRLGLRLIEPRANIVFKVAACMLLSMALLADFSFARSRSFSRSSSTPSCVVSLAQMKSTLERALGQPIQLTQNERAFIHVQHQQMGCAEYTKYFEKSQFYSSASKRAAAAQWHWKIYHSKNQTTRAEVLHDIEVVLGHAEAAELIPVAAELQNADVR